MAATHDIRIGDRLITRDGKELGRIKELHDTCIHVKRGGRRDYWLPRNAVESHIKGLAILGVTNDQLANLTIDVDEHKGAHSHKDVESRPSGGPKTLMFMLPLAIMLLRDKQKREKLVSFASGVMSRLGSRSQPGGESATGSNGSSYRMPAPPQGTGGGNASGIATGDLEAMKPPPQIEGDAVDEASWESFPASDPPARY